jgi:hypothetical protein
MGCHDNGDNFSLLVSFASCYGFTLNSFVLICSLLLFPLRLSFFRFRFCLSILTLSFLFFFFFLFFFHRHALLHQQQSHRVDLFEGLASNGYALLLE